MPSPADRRSAAQYPAARHSAALLITADQYRDPRLSRLRSPGRNARELAAALSDPEIGDFQVSTLTNEPAHLLSEQIEEFFADRQSDDLLLLYFSCHGITDDSGRLHFATVNTRPGLLASTGISSTFLAEQMKRCRSSKIVVVLDCCYSGAFAHDPPPRADRRIDLGELQGPGRAIMTGSTAVEYVFGMDEGEITGTGMSSVFTNALVEGLRTGIADYDGDGWISVDEFYDHVYEHVRTETPDQNPGLWTADTSGKLTLARSQRGEVSNLEPLPPQVLNALRHPLPKVRAGVVPELAALLASPRHGFSAAARAALDTLHDDESPAVADAARDALAAHEHPDYADLSAVLAGEAEPKVAETSDDAAATRDGDAPKPEAGPESKKAGDKKQRREKKEKEPEDKKPEDKEPENEKPEGKEPEDKEPEGKEPEGKEPEKEKPGGKEPEGKKPEKEKRPVLARWPRPANWLRGSVGLLGGRALAGNQRYVALAVVTGLVLVAVTLGSRGATWANRVWGCGNRPLIVAASAEKANVMTQLANLYNSSSSRSGACVRVTSTDSGRSMSQLQKTGRLPLDGDNAAVWSPASSLWVELARETVTGQRAVAADYWRGPAGVASTPLVLAVPASAPHATASPETFRWSDLAKLSGTIYKTQITSSTTALHTSIAEFAAAGGALGKQLAVTDIDSTAAKQMVRTIESLVEHDQESNTTKLLARLCDQAKHGTITNEIAAIPLEEKTLWNYVNGDPEDDGTAQCRDTSAKSHPMRVIYPKDGTLVSDSPYVILDQQRKTDATSFYQFLKKPDSRQSLERHGFRTATPDRRLGPLNGQVDDPAAVANSHLSTRFPDDRPLQWPDQINRSVVDEVTQLWGSVARHARVLLALDVSGSMGAGTPRRVDVLKDAATEALKGFNTNDEIGLWEFFGSGHQEGAKIISLGEQGQRNDLNAQLRDLDFQPNSSTPLYKTMTAAVEQMMQDYQKDAFNAVVVFTDGGDYPSDAGQPARFEELVNVLIRDVNTTKVPVSVITYAGKAETTVCDQNGGAGEDQRRQLQNLLAATGGGCTRVNAGGKTGLQEVFASVLSRWTEGHSVLSP